MESAWESAWEGRDDTAFLHALILLTRADHSVDRHSAHLQSACNSHSPRAFNMAFCRAAATGPFTRNDMRTADSTCVHSLIRRLGSAAAVLLQCACRR